MHFSFYFVAGILVEYFDLFLQMRMLVANDELDVKFEI